jgi:hypothetical protein
LTLARLARLAAATLALGMAGFGYQQPGLLVCEGDFAQFANGFMVARPMELHFVVDWLAPSVVPTDGGGPGRIIALTSLELSFEVSYEGYRVAYHVNRIDGSISQRPNLGGVFFGDCDMRALGTRF